MNRYLALLAMTFACAGCSTTKAPGNMDARDVTGYMRRLSRSTSPEANEIKARLKTAPSDMARELNEVQRAGIPLNAAQLQKPPIPLSKNAAILYSQLPALPQQRAIFSKSSNETELISEPMSARYTYSAEQIAQARDELRARTLALDVIHRAADKPNCVFARNWQLGPGLLFPEFSNMRTSARLLASESYMMALDGDFHSAVRNQARGFRLAQHAGSDPTIISLLVGVAIDAITLRGMENILYLAGPNSDVANAIRAEIAKNRPHYSYRYALEGELPMVQISMNMLRAGKPQDFVAVLPTVGAEGSNENNRPAPASFSAEERDFISRVLDAAQAEALRLQRERILAADKPYAERIAALKKLQPDEKNDRGPIAALVDLFAPVFSQTAAAEVRSTANEEALMAGAAVLAYKGRHGNYPRRLDQALPKLPVDPFTGGPLGYRLEKSGFVIYSVGESGKFDGGKPGMKRESKEAYFRYPPPPAQSWTEEHKSLSGVARSGTPRGGVLYESKKE